MHAFVLKLRLRAIYAEGAGVLEKKEPLFKYYILVILAGMCWGMTGMLQALAPEGASSVTIGSVRMAGAGFLLLIYSLITGGFSIFRLKLGRGGILITATAQVAYQMSFFSAVRLTGVALGTMIAIGMSPAIAGLLGRLFYSEKLTGRWYFSTAAAFAGCAMLVFGGAREGVTVNFQGCVLAGVASLSYAFFGVGLRKTGKADAVHVAALVFTVAGLLSAPVLVFGDTSWMLSPRGILVILVLCVVSTILPLILFARGVRRVPLGSAYTLSMTEPVTAFLLAVFLLNERVPPISMLGAALVLFSIYTLARTTK